MRITGFISLLLILVFSEMSGQDINKHYYQFGLRVGAWTGHIFSSPSPSPELALIRHGRILDVGLLGGYRHLAYGSKFQNPFGTVLPDNLIDAQDSGGQTTYPEGDRVRGFFTSRFYQSYFHLYIGRTFYFNKRFNGWLGLAPGVEYLDDVKPITAETVHFVNDRPTADQFYLYTTSYKRIVAYGYLLSLGANYNVGNMYLQLGFERSNYFEGTTYKYLFLGAGFRIPYRDVRN